MNDSERVAPKAQIKKRRATAPSVPTAGSIAADLERQEIPADAASSTAEAKGRDAAGSVPAAGVPREPQRIRRELNAEAKTVRRRKRAEARAVARAQREQAAQAKAEVEREAAAAREQELADHIVEAPRGPKVSFLERRRQNAAGSASDGGPQAVAIVAVIVGALGLACSLVLAVGALMAALGTTERTEAYDVLSTICDALVGPLRDVFTFSGANADMKEAVVTWGAGSMIYVLAGMFVQSYLRSRVDD